MDLLGNRITKPSKVNEAAFFAAVAMISHASGDLFKTLQTNAPPKNRAEEVAKARAHSAKRFARQA